MKLDSKHWILIIIVILVAISAVYLVDSNFIFESGSEKEANQIGLEVGNTAPNFSIETLDGDKIELSDYQDKFVILDFMAVWCAPCKVEMNHLKQIYHNFSEEKLEIISIDVDPTEKNETIRDFKVKYGDNWIFASGPEVGVEYKVSGIPTIYVLSPNREIIFKNSGVVPASTISDKINSYS